MNITDGMEVFCKIEQVQLGLYAAKNYILAKLGEIETDANKKFVSKPQSTAGTISATGWQTVTDDSATYKYYYDIAVNGVSEKDIATVTVAPQSIDTANTCGLCPANETLENKIRVYAKLVPTAAINFEYYILKGK